MESSKVHSREVSSLSMFKLHYPDGLVPFDDGRCSFCGSLHPSKVVEAIKAGAGGEFADMKYGWPHKVYLHDVPGLGHAKFYTVHLQDAMEEERQIIESYLGLTFTFTEDGGVSWKRYEA